jgi:hypothetical protein
LSTIFEFQNIKINCPKNANFVKRLDNILSILKKLESSVTRSCQLSLPGSTAAVTPNVGGGGGGGSGGGNDQDLKKWLHINPAREGVLDDDPVLQRCSGYLSYLFKKKTN